MNFACMILQNSMIKDAYETHTVIKIYSAGKEKTVFDILNCITV